MTKNTPNSKVYKYRIGKNTMGWRKSTVDFLIFFFVGIGVGLLFTEDYYILAFIFVCLALAVSIFRREIYNALK